MKLDQKSEIEKAVEYSRASAALEGIRESEYLREINKLLISGKISIDEAIQKTRERYGLDTRSDP